MGDERTSTVEWQAIDPYYKYLYEIWTKIARFRLELNQAKGTEQYYWMDQWYTFTNMWYDAIYYMLSADEIEKVNKKLEEITQITDHSTFEAAGLSIKDSTKIKVILSNLHRGLWQFQGKYQILPKRVQKNTATENW